MCTLAQTPTTNHYHQHTNNTMNNSNLYNIIVNWFNVNFKGNVMNTIINATSKVNTMCNLIFVIILFFVSACNFSDPDKAFSTAQYRVESAIRQADYATVDKMLVSMKIADALKDYKDVADMVEKFNKDNKPKPYAKVDVKLFVEQMHDFFPAKCSAWKWKGKVWSIKHCVTRTKEEQADDPVAELKKTTLEADFYEEGLECSPDVRWWGGTTNRWVTIPIEQIFRFTRNSDVPLAQKFSAIGAYGNATSALLDYNWAVESKKSTKDKKEAAKKAFIAYYKNVNYIKTTYIAQEYLCSSSLHRDVVKAGDSGGPIMLGDEVIGSVSYEAYTHHPDFDSHYGASALSNYAVSCFSAIDAPSKKLSYVNDLEVEYTEVFNNYTNAFGIVEVSGWIHE